MNIVRSKVFAWFATFALVGAHDALLAKDAVDILLEDDTLSPRLSVGAGNAYKKGTHLLYSGVAIEGFKPETIFWKAEFDYFCPTGKNQFHVYEVELEGNIGYTFRIDAIDGLSTALFTGLGFAHYDFNQGVIQNQNLYMPFGFYLNWQANDALQVGLRTQVNVMYARTLERLDTQYHVGRTTFWNAELPIRYNVTGQWDISLVPFWKYEPSYNFNAVGEGEMITMGYEKLVRSASTTGIMIEIGYKL